MNAGNDTAASRNGYCHGMPASTPAIASPTIAAIPFAEDRGPCTFVPSAPEYWPPMSAVASSNQCWVGCALNDTKRKERLEGTHKDNECSGDTKQENRGDNRSPPVDIGENPNGNHHQCRGDEKRGHDQPDSDVEHGERSTDAGDGDGYGLITEYTGERQK